MNNQNVFSSTTKIRLSMKTALVILLTLVPFSASAKSVAKNYRMIALGDSLSAGFLGFTEIAPERNAQALRNMSVVGDESGYQEPPPPNVWNGIRYPALVESKSEWSWATGVYSGSVAMRLSDYLNTYGPHGGARINWLNMSESGAVAAHLPRQVRLQLQKGNAQQEIALVTLMIGANDACSSLTTTDEEARSIRTSMRETFRRLAMSRPKSMGNDPVRVYVASVPDIPALGSPRFLKHKAYAGLTCGDIRENLVNFCPILLNWKTEEEYHVREKRVAFINDLIRQSAEAAREEFQELSIHFDMSFNHYPLTPSLLAMDCFHPGRKGQTELAKVLWNSMPWFRAPQLQP